jgi:hypothetical protein
MTINYVKGQILAGNLERDGIDLSISNANVGINTLSPTSTFEVAGNVKVGNVIISNIGNITMGNRWINTLNEPYANSDAATKFYVDSQIGNIVTANIGNLNITNNTISSINTNANINIDPNGSGTFVIVGTNGFVMPAGNTTQRPSPVAAGTLRFNNETLRLEYYDGSQWDIIAGDVTNQTLNGDGSTTTFTLNRSTTTAGALIMLNGVVQLPTTAYSMVPNPSANLVFTEAPASTDVIDIRYL